MNRLVTTLAILALGVSTAGAADDPAVIFKEAADLYQAGDIDGALSEARWGVERLEQLKQASEGKLFRDEIAGYVGGELTSSKAMGLTQTQRTYAKGDQKIEVQLMGSSGAGAGPLAGLGALAQFGAQVPGSRQVRIQRRTGFAMADGAKSTVSLTLESGGTLMFTSSQVDLDGVIAFAEAFPVKDLDEARK